MKRRNPITIIEIVEKLVTDKSSNRTRKRHNIVLIKMDQYLSLKRNKSTFRNFLGVALFFFFAVSGVPASAQQFGDPPFPQINSTGSVHYASGSKAALSVQCNPSPCQPSFFNPYISNYMLKATTHNGVFSYPFSASDDYFHVYWGVSFHQDVTLSIVLLRAVRHKVKPQKSEKWYLDILDIGKDRIVKKYEKVIGGYLTSDKTWWYKVNFSPVNHNGYYVINLALEHSNFNSTKSNKMKSLPKERQITIYWNKKTHSYSEHGN